MASIVSTGRTPTASDQQARQRRSFWLGYGLLIVLFLLVMQLMRMFAAPFGAAMFVLILTIGLTLLRPAVGLGAAIVLTIIGDAVAMPWWPVSKNMSAYESVLYVADALTVKPLELILIAVIAVYFISKRLTPSAPPIIWGPLWKPMVIFSFTLVTGLAWGLGRGGDFRVSMFEITSLVYIPMVYLAAINLFRSIDHYKRLMVGILVAIVIEAIHGIYRLPEIRSVIAEDQSPLEHTAVLHMNLLLLLFVGTLWFGTRVRGKRFFLVLLLAPTLYLYLDAQRRAGVVALIIGGIALTVVLFARNRVKFYRVIPIVLVFTAVYSAAFWNSENQFAFPAQAIKTVVQPGASSEKDQRSDLYREIENFNLNATIRSNPVLGIGFGHPFLQPIPLPDISFYEFSPYIPHNSVLWVWTKLGIVGFVSFLYLIALGTARGMRAAVRARDPDEASIVATITAYLPMMLALAFVEITFDATTTVLFGLALAFAGSVEGMLETDASDQGETTVAHRRPATASVVRTVSADMKPVPESV